MRRRRVAASVTLLAVAFGGSACTDDEPETSSPTPSASVTDAATVDPALDAEADAARVRAENQRRKDAAIRKAERILASMPLPEGAAPVSARHVRPLKIRSIGGASFVTRVAYYSVPRSPVGLAEWFTRRPPPGMGVEGEPDRVLRYTRNSHWFESIDLASRRQWTAFATAGVTITPIAAPKFMSSRRWFAGIRISVTTAWRPVRPASTYTPDDVTEVRILSTYERFTDRKPQRTVVSDPDDIARLRDAYDALEGAIPYVHSCPFVDGTNYRVMFVGETRTVRTEFSPCYSVWSVVVQGEHVEPDLTEDSNFLRVVRGLTRR